MATGAAEVLNREAKVVYSRVQEQGVAFQKSLVEFDGWLSREETWDLQVLTFATRCFMKDVAGAKGADTPRIVITGSFGTKFWGGCSCSDLDFLCGGVNPEDEPTSKIHDRMKESKTAVTVATKDKAESGSEKQTLSFTFVACPELQCELSVGSTYDADRAEAMRLMLKFLPEQHSECIAAATAVVYLKCLFKSFGIHRPIPSIALTILAIAAARERPGAGSAWPAADLPYRGRLTGQQVKK